MYIVKFVYFVEERVMKIKLAYIGGGSKQWARAFMNDLAFTDDPEG